MRLKSLKESAYIQGRLYRLKKDAKRADVSLFFEDVYEYSIRGSSSDVILPWDADIKVLSNGQVEVSGNMIPGGPSGARCVCTMSIEKFSELVVLDFDLDEDEMNQELFDSCFEEI